MKLWTHQARDIDTYIQCPGQLNFSEPGTGKTRVCIEAIKALKLPTLILAPKSILQCAWGNDIEKFAPELEYKTAYASNRYEVFKAGAPIIITNHDAATWLMEKPQLLEQFRGGFLIIDESTAYKNPNSKRSKAAMKIRELFEYCTVLTGTPTPQGLIDIWSQVYLVDKGQRLGKSYYRFRALTYTPINKGAFTQWVEKPGMVDAVAELVSDITIRNIRDDCMDLPDNFIVHRNFDLTKQHLDIYRELKSRAILRLESGDITAVNAAVLLSKLLQVASGAVYDERGEPHPIATERYELIMDLVEERDHSLVVFNWRHQRNALVDLARQRRYTFEVIDGETSDARRTKAVDDFQAGKLKCLFIHPQSAGHGLTLTKGCATIWASPTYNAEHFEQVNARINRGGQTRVTETILISANNTVDNDAYKKLLEKRLHMQDLLEILKT